MPRIASREPNDEQAPAAAVYGAKRNSNFLNVLDIFEVPRMLRCTRNILAKRV